VISSGDSTALLARLGFRSPERSLRELEPGWDDDRRWLILLDILGDTADPDGGLRRLRRLGDDVVRAVLDAPLEARPLVEAVAFGEYLTDLCIRTPDLALEILGRASPVRTDLREVRDAGLVKIAASDLSAEPTEESFRTASSALSRLADECVTLALGENAPLAVMAMGKYGGDELNYASDIDVLFVCAEQESAERAARRVIEVMNGPPALFRVDADLRPEGRDGPLVRTLDSYRAYYARWAHVWEFQALIKCRFGAGDASLGAAFMDMIQPFVWPEELRPEALDEIRAMKARAERQAASGGAAAREVKLGPGGIRDVEFAVQLLQLVHGRYRPDLRARSTLDALDVMGAEGYVAPDDARELADAYVFLRHVEHRLQLQAGRQTHTLPDTPQRREYIARGLGFRDTPRTPALAAFEERWSQTTAVVRGIHEQLFYRPLLETFAAAPAGVVAMAADAADERLRALGFDRPPRVREAITSMTSGASRRAKVMRAILPGVLAWTAETPEPDQALLRLADVVANLEAMPHLLAVLRDEPPIVELL
jgi:glutamate-ammonia-ligase adenylyltransferase